MFRRAFLALLCYFWLSCGFVSAQTDGYRQAMAQFEAAKRIGDYVGGEQRISEALKYGHGDEYAWRSLAWCQSHQGKWQELLATANENVRRNGQTAWSLLQLYEFNMGAGDFRVAGQALEAAGNLRDWQGIDLRKTYEQYLARISSKTYDVEIELAPAGHHEHGNVRFLIPMNCERQQFVARVVQGADNPKFTSNEGKEFLEATLIEGQRATLKGKLTLKPYLVGSKMLAASSPEDAATMQAYLGKFRHGGRNTYDPQLPELQEISSRLDGGTALQRASAILLWLRKNFRYEDLKVDDLPSIIAAHHGVCHHYCGLFCALARSLQIPTRILHVTVMPDIALNETATINKPGTPTKAHGQNEVWLGSIGWIPLEPQRPESLGNYINSVMLFDRAGNGTNDDHWRFRSTQGCPMTIRLVNTAPGIN